MDKPLAIILSNTPQPSYRVVGELIAECLREAGISVLERGVPATSDERASLAKEYEEQNAVFFHNVAMGNFHIIPGMKNIALPAYEFSRIWNSAVEQLNQYDEIWVTTRHVAEVLKNSGVTAPIVKTPPALDRGIYPEKTDHAPRKPFRFLFVGEPHFRKGIHFLMYGFIKAFPDVGEAELVIRSGDTPGWDVLREDIKFAAEWLPANDLRNLYAENDCYISASLAEGLGLPIAESILCGLPVCANYWGGHRDLLTDGGYFPLSFVESPRPWTGAPQFYTPGQKCAISDETAVAAAMRDIVMSTPEKRREIAKKARENLLKNYGAASVRAVWAAHIAQL